MLDNKEYYAPLLEGQSSALDAAEESPEDHSEAAALAHVMSRSESQPDGPTRDQPKENDGPQLEPEAPQSDAAPSEREDSTKGSKKDEAGGSHNPEPEILGEDAQDGSGSPDAKPDDSSQPADEASKSAESNSQGAMPSDILCQHVHGRYRGSL